MSVNRSDPRGATSATPVSRSSERRPPVEAAQGASQQNIGIHQRLVAAFLHHQLVAVETLLRLLSRPASSLMTWLVIAIALTLPGALLMAIDNLEQLSGSFQESGRITLYLKNSVSDDEAMQLATRLRQLNDINEIRYISREEALAQFSASSGLADALALLPENPLPAEMVVEPPLGLDTAHIQDLLARLSDYDQVEAAELDMAWLNRLRAILSLGQRVVLVLGGLLALAILLVVGNTIRMAIAARVDEIRVVKLVGGTDAWVRRPFLYTGLWYGMVGGLISWCMLALLWLLLRDPAAELARLYGSGFVLQPLDAGEAGLLLLAGMLLGWVGAWWSVSRHLDEIEP